MRLRRGIFFKYKGQLYLPSFQAEGPGELSPNPLHQRRDLVTMVTNKVRGIAMALLDYLKDRAGLVAGSPISARQRSRGNGKPPPNTLYLGHSTTHSKQKDFLRDNILVGSTGNTENIAL